MIIKELQDKGLIHPPNWLANNTCLLTMMGSVAYGVSSDTSDMDIYGVTIPRREEVFPHLKGEILGFGRQKQRFEQWSEHHIKDESSLGGKGREYDFTVFGIVKYFQLCMDNNPNALDSLFVPQNCVLHITKVGNLIRENRKKFLHKGCFPRLKGYAYSQSKKIRLAAQDKDVQDMTKYEDSLGIHHDTTMSNILEEMRIRKMTVPNT